MSKDTNSDKPETGAVQAEAGLKRRDLLLSGGFAAQASAAK
jgi:hypothetical protein